MTTRDDDPEGSGPDLGPGPTPQPVACDPTVIPLGLERHVAEYGSVFAAALVETDRAPRRVRFTLRGDPHIEARARLLAARESRCCSFLTQRFEHDRGQLIWTMTNDGNPAAEAILDQLVQLADPAG